MVKVIGRHGPEVFQISGARKSLSEDVRGRERRYVISMLVRTFSVLLTVVLWNVSRPLAVALLVLGVALPYVAVVIANAGRENSPAIPSAVLGPPSRPELEEGPSGSPDTEAQRPSATEGRPFSVYDDTSPGAGGTGANTEGRAPGGA